MRCADQTVQLQICKTILSIYTNKSPPKEVQGMCPCSEQFNKSIVEKSDISETLVKVKLKWYCFVIKIPALVLLV